jgi:hypothetical protein
MGYMTRGEVVEMAKPKFGGKKAAPFKRGGGRKKNSPRTAKGRKRK